VPEWLRGAGEWGHLSPAVLLGRLLLASLFGGLVAAVYAVTQRRPRAEVVPFATTLVLLAVLIAMVTLVIGDNIARAFSLAGALAIIRFRTVVEDTRDTAFVIFAVVVGMAIGAGLLAVPLVGVPVVAAAAALLGRLDRAVVASPGDHLLVVRYALGRDPGPLAADVFAKHLATSRVTSAATARQGAALEIGYHVRLRHPDGAVRLVADMNQLDGVQGVELRPF
jgi:hypothetical protein